MKAAVILVCVILLAGCADASGSVSSQTLPSDILEDLSAEPFDPMQDMEDAAAHSSEAGSDDQAKENEDHAASEDFSGALTEGDNSGNIPEDTSLSENAPEQTDRESRFQYSLIPEYDGSASVSVNDNIPFFTDEERTAWLPGTEVYPPLDTLGRCGAVYACIGTETMPDENEVREEIGMIKPSGWHTEKYPDLIEDLFLYNRCHLIGWQLGGENANEANLITGTRYLNISGMLPYENRVAYYIRGSGNHVLYRVTPYFEGDEFLARGVLIEAESPEDKEFHFCVWCYNVQPGIGIDYATGESRIIDRSMDTEEEILELILNTNTKKAHRPDCESVDDMKEKNKEYFKGTLQELKEKGYTACGRCHPF